MRAKYFYRIQKQRRIGNLRYIKKVSNKIVFSNKKKYFKYRTNTSEIKVSKKVFAT